MPNTGLNSYLGIDPEATYGVDPASGNEDWLRIVSENLRFLGDRTQGNRGLGRMVRSAVRSVNRRTAGDIVLDLNYAGAEALLAHFFGALATTGAGPYTHTITPSLTRQKGLTLRMQQDALLTTILGAKPQSCNFTMTQENIEATIGIIGKPGLIAAGATTPGFDDHDGSTFAVIPVEATPANGLTTKYDGSEICVQSGSVNCALPHAEDRVCLGDQAIDEPIINDYLTIEGEIVREFDDDSFEDDWQAFTEKTLEFNYKSEDTLAATGQGEFRIKLFAVQLLEAKPPTEGPSAITETIPFVAVPDSSGDIIEIVYINGRVTVAL